MICKAEGCTKELSDKNVCGYCRHHTSQALGALLRARCVRVPCQGIGCHATVVLNSQTSPEHLCRYCRNLVYQKQYRSHSRAKAREQERGIATAPPLTRGEAVLVCKEVGCDSPPVQGGYCAMCWMFHEEQDHYKERHAPVQPTFTRPTYRT